MNISQTLVGKLIQDDNSLMTPENRNRVGLLGGFISVTGNLLLFIVKIIFGFLSNSLALIADAFHTLSDVATSIVVIIGFKVSQKPADAEHPFGHGRAETIATLIIAILMVVVGIEFIINGAHRLLQQVEVTGNISVILVIILSIFLKELMARFSFFLGNTINSDTLKGDAQHHRADVFSSMLVVVALVGANFGIAWLDGLMGIGVAIMIFYTAFFISKNAIDDLLGKPVSSETLEEIKEISRSVDGVLNIHDIIVHSYGGHRFISLHVEVDEKIPVEKFHKIADTVEKHITTQMHAEVVTHVDPVSNTGSAVNRINHIITKVLTDFELKDKFQDLRVMGEGEITSIMFEVPIPHNYTENSNLKKELKNSLLNEFNKSEIKIEFKQQIIYN